MPRLKLRFAQTRHGADKITFVKYPVKATKIRELLFFC